MNKKILIPITIILFLSILPLASATVVYNRTTNSGNFAINTIYPATNTSSSTWGQTFQPSSSGYLTSIALYRQTSGDANPTGYAILYIYDETRLANTFGTNMQPTAPPNAAHALNYYDSSSTIWLGDWAKASWFTFTFPGTEYLDSNKKYSFELHVISQTIDSAHPILLGGSAQDSGNSYYQYNSGWEVSTQDLSATISVSATAATTPSPTPIIDAVDPNSFWNTGLGAQIFSFIPTLTSLIVVLIAAFLGWKFAGPWGFFAGINLGYIISVIFNILPLWGMIALLVVDGLLLFGKVGFRN